MASRFDGQSVLVTGAAGGLGRAIAQGFARDGARLFLLDVDTSGLGETEQQIRSAGGQAESHKIDLASEADIKAFAERFLAQHSSLNVLVNNAGLAYGQVSYAFSGLSLADWSRFFAVNSIAPVLLADALKPALANAKGLIVNQSSMASFVPGTAYGVTKATLNAMTFAMATQYAGDEIRAVAIAPGLMETDASSAHVPEEARARLQSMQLVRRGGTAEDIANLTLFLASPEGSFINNEVILADGGNQMRGWRV